MRSLILLIGHDGVISSLFLQTLPPSVYFCHINVVLAGYMGLCFTDYDPEYKTFESPLKLYKVVSSICIVFQLVLLLYIGVGMVRLTEP